MLTKLTVRNFKQFEHAEIDLAQNVVFVGPNNSGKTTALQALALWHLGLSKWYAKRKGTNPELRTGIGISRRDLLAVPIPNAAHLWRQRHFRDGQKNIRIEIVVDGIHEGAPWSCGLEFDYDSPDSFHCRPLRLTADGSERMRIPSGALQSRIAYLPPMSGLYSNETRIEPGAIRVRLGEGRTAEVLRNICLHVWTQDSKSWEALKAQVRSLFGTTIREPEYLADRGEISMSYEDVNGVELDLSASGRGMQQTLLLLSYLAWNPGAALLLDEPDAHLEILRQKEIYDAVSSAARASGGQIIAASHSEVVLNAAATKDVVIAFVGKPHRIDARTNNVLKALREIRYDEYYRAEQTGWVLYVEGETDVAALLAMARRLNHKAAELLSKPFFVTVGTHAGAAKTHFEGLREAKPDIAGFALFDNFGAVPRDFPPGLSHHQWRRREIECYFATRSALLEFAKAQGRAVGGDLFGPMYTGDFEKLLDEIATSFQRIKRMSPWSNDAKITDDFLDTVFAEFYQSIGLPVLTRKSAYHVLADFVTPDEIDAEVIQVLDAIVETAGRARPAQ